MTFCRERNSKNYSASSFLAELERKELGLIDGTMAKNSAEEAEAQSYLLDLMKQKGILENV